MTEESLGSYATPAEKSAPVPLGLHELIRARWSPRSFADRPVSDKDLHLILEAGRWAASSGNEQPWRFLVAPKSDSTTYQRLLGVLVPSNQEWAKTAPVLVLTVAKLHLASNGSSNRHAMHDTGAALAQMMLQTVALGLFAHAMAGFDVEKARREFHIPEGYEPAAAVAIGYLASPHLLPERYAQREAAARERKNLNELAFGANWGEPLPELK